MLYRYVVCGNFTQNYQLELSVRIINIFPLAVSFLGWGGTVDMREW